jgi:hypothetical protein
MTDAQPSSRCRPNTGWIRAATRGVPIALRRQKPFAQETFGPPICAALPKRRRARHED